MEQCYQEQFGGTPSILYAGDPLGDLSMSHLTTANDGGNQMLMTVQNRNKNTVRMTKCKALKEDKF